MGRDRIRVLVGSLVLVIGTFATSAAAADPSPPPADAFEFVPIGRMAHGRIGHSATLLPDGRVLAIGGYETATAEIWDPLTGEWTLTGSMAGPREGHQAHLLDDGSVVVLGGHRPGDEEVPPPEVWDPVTGNFGPAESLAASLDVEAEPDPDLDAAPYQGGATRTRLADGRVLVTGGSKKDDPSCTGLCGMSRIAGAAIWDPATGVTIELPPMNVPREDHTGTLLLDGRVLLVGAHTHGDLDRTAELFQPVGFTGASSALTGATAIASGESHTCALADGGRVVCWGADDVGQLGDGPDAEVVRTVIAPA